MIKTSRYKGLVLGSFLALETDMIFRGGVEGLLCQNGDEMTKKGKEACQELDTFRNTETQN